MADHSSARLTNGRVLSLFGVFGIYLLLRLVAWQQTVLVEDHDSLVYLDQIKIFRTFDLTKILNMGGFTTQFYPFSAAMLTWPGWSAETSARACALFFSLLLFLSLWGIGQHIAGGKGVVFGLTILAFSPILIPFSFSILAEPVYVAIIYSGLWLFWSQYADPKLSKAGLLGIIFGIGFLTRLEGLLNIILIPLLQGIYFFFKLRKESPFKRFASWTAAFVFTFSLLIGLQILRVSQKFGYFAIDERQVWTVARQILDGKSYEEQMNGLNFSPGQINLDYIRSHPEVQARAASTASKEVVVKSVKTVMFNLDDLYRNKLNILFGPLGLIFFAGGLYALVKHGGGWNVFVILTFIVFSLVGPLLYQVQIRYIAIIAPIVMLVEGIGLVYVANALATLFNWKWTAERSLSFVCLCLLLAGWVLPLYWFYTSPQRFNGEYSPASLQEPIRIIKTITQTELHRPPTLAARKGYVIYYADAKPAALPYTDIEGLAKFCEINGVDFVFLEHRLIQGYPFLEAFNRGDLPARFLLLHRGTDAFGGTLELYRFQNHYSPVANRLNREL
jgi:hypothetical protein